MSKYGVRVNNLILEVTRKCNMNCQHCLRGDAQNVDMTEDIVDKVFESIDSVYSITFTGGEPSLNIPIMKYIFEKAKKQGLSSFWLATNGKANQLELSQLLMEQYLQMEDKEFCGVALSIDDYHDDDILPYVKCLTFYDSSKENGDFQNDLLLLNEGKAYENGIGVRSIDLDDKLYISDVFDESIVIDLLYVNALGQIVTDCDCSYITQEGCNLGSITEIQKVLQNTLELPEAV